MSEEKVTFTIFLFDKKKEDALGIDLGEINGEITVRVDQIAAVRHIAAEDGLVKDRCSVYTKYGDNFHVSGSKERILEYLNEFGW